MDRNNAGKLLASLRDANDWTQAKLSRESGVCRSIISQIECGKMVLPRHHIPDLAKVLPGDAATELLSAWRLDRASIGSHQELMQMSATLSKLAG